MKRLLICCLALFIMSSLHAQTKATIGKRLSRELSQLPAGQAIPVLVYFKDKGTLPPSALTDPRAFVSERSLKRRLKVRSADNLIDEKDFPLERTYVRRVAAQVSGVRHELKWFNALSVMATGAEIQALRGLPFVRAIEIVGAWKRNFTDEVVIPQKETAAVRQPAGVYDLDYGASFGQLNQISVPSVHRLGIYGQGVVVGVFDNGFRLPNHEAFASMKIIATHDFVDHKVSVVPNNPSTGFGAHGVATLSTIGGYKPGSLIGPAFGAEFILARTENDSSETPVEEDNWAKAIEWADSIGVDVTSTSLGYLGYDPPYTSWTWQDMNGNTTLITKAADRAVGLGIVVVNSAGNSGYNATQNTLIAPADGDSVITAGAVDISGARASFSSVGPTFDGRTKPDIMADGVGVWVASATNPTAYGGASGTSFSCPLSAGVAALIVCANPKLTPIQVREAMRQTASNHVSPNNTMGWGILNAIAAVQYAGIAAHISGVVFHDINGNGLKEAGEPFINGRKVVLTGSAQESTVTNSHGKYRFDSLSFGTYSVDVPVVSGWIRTIPGAPPDTVVIDSFSTSNAGRDFGLFQLGTVRGSLFNDLNVSGARDSGEPGMPQWTVKLTGPVTLSAVTDSLGGFTFTGILPGTYTLAESVKADWGQSLPPGNANYSITVTSGLDSSGLVFGNYFSTIHYQVKGRWSLISLPLKTADSMKNVIYPTAVSEAFIYDSGYKISNILHPGRGFWLKFPADEDIPIVGQPLTSDTVTLHERWNIVGSIYSPVPVKDIVEIPDSNIVSPYYGFDTAYYVADTLKPHHGYWVKANAQGKLILAGPALRGGSGPPTDHSGLKSEEPLPKPLRKR